MPNGRPGDHPITDIVVHGRTIYGPEIDDRIRRLAGSGRRPVLDLLETLIYAWLHDDHMVINPTGFAAVLDRLLKLIDGEG